MYKSISSVRSVVTRLKEADLHRLDDVTTCPTQFQAYVSGIDHRVHVVGDQVFCCRIESSSDDYRYAARDGGSIHKTETSLPEPWRKRCIELAHSEGLSVAGLDLRLTPAGDWYCFEVNPSPAFTYYEEPGQPIARSVAALLATAFG